MHIQELILCKTERDTISVAFYNAHSTVARAARRVAACFLATVSFPALQLATLRAAILTRGAPELRY